MHKFQNTGCKEGLLLRKDLIKCWFSVNILNLSSSCSFQLFTNCTKTALFSQLQGTRSHSKRTRKKPCKVNVTVHKYRKSVSGPILLTAKMDLDNISHNCCPWPKGVSWPWPKVISPTSRSQCTHTKNLYAGHYSSLPCWILIIFHTIVVHDLRLCHDLDPRSYHQGQGHSAYILKIRVQAITPLCHVGSGKYSTQLLSMTRGCVMTLTQGHMTLTQVHISKVNITVKTYPKSLSEP